MTSAQNSPQSRSRRSYHVRRESNIIPKTNKPKTRKRSHTAEINISTHRKNINKKRINRRFDSITDSICIKFEDQDSKSDIIETTVQKSKNKKNTNKQSQNNISDTTLTLHNILQQFRDIITPLQTEIKTLKQITVDLQSQVHILQTENALFRKYHSHTHNHSRLNNQSLTALIENIDHKNTNGIYIDYESVNYDFTDMDLNIPNLPDSNMESVTVTPNHKQSMSVNPVYLFSPQSKFTQRTRTISNATLRREEQIMNLKDTNMDKIDTEMEEDELEIGSKMKYGHRKGVLSVTQVYLDGDVDILSENEHIPHTPESVSSTKSIEQTYNRRRNSMASLSDSLCIETGNGNDSNVYISSKPQRDQKYKMNNY